MAVVIRNRQRVPKKRTYSMTPRPSRSAYKAAAPWRDGGFVSTTQAVNHLIASASPRLRAHVRDLVRNFPLFARGLNAYTAFLVGRGVRFQSLATGPDGKPDHALRRKIEQRFRLWMAEDADISGGLHFSGLQSLLCRQMLESGEGFFQFVNRRNYRINPLALMPLEVERVRSDYATSQLARDDVRLLMGVEYDARTGERLAYHVADDDEYFANVTRVPANDIIHIFQTLRVGQLRGVTPFAPAILFARAMAEYTQSELDSTKMASKYMAFVTSDDISGFQQSRGIRAPGGVATQQETPPIEELENSIIEYLRPNEKISFADLPARPGESFINFTQFVMRMVSITIDVPFEMLSNDYTNINYSTSKAIRGDTNLLHAPHKALLEHRFCNRVFRRWLDYEYLTQDYLPDYVANPLRYQQALWIPTGLPSVDPQKDVSADIMAIKAGLKSPQSVILSRGDDPEEVLAQLQDWAEYLKMHKLSSDFSETTANVADVSGAVGELTNDAAPSSDDATPTA